MDAARARREDMNIFARPFGTRLSTVQSGGFIAPIPSQSSVLVAPAAKPNTQIFPPEQDISDARSSHQLEVHHSKTAADLESNVMRGQTAQDEKKIVSLVRCRGNTGISFAVRAGDSSGQLVEKWALFGEMVAAIDPEAPGVLSFGVRVWRTG
ncbi:hypothetical protein MN608_09237 [Microdochium nivale]|nr:hypothetical protein MN608_09237 [Microdochium nivale]